MAASCRFFQSLRLVHNFLETTVKKTTKKIFLIWPLFVKERAAVKRLALEEQAHSMNYPCTYWREHEKLRNVFTPTVLQSFRRAHNLFQAPSQSPLKRSFWDLFFVAEPTCWWFWASLPARPQVPETSQMDQKKEHSLRETDFQLEKHNNLITFILMFTRCGKKENLDGEVCAILMFCLFRSSHGWLQNFLLFVLLEPATYFFPDIFKIMQEWQCLPEGYSEEQPELSACETDLEVSVRSRLRLVSAGR